MTLIMQEQIEHLCQRLTTVERALDIKGKDVLTLAEAAIHMGYKRSYMYKMITNGSDMPREKVNNKWVFKRVLLDVWQKKRQGIDSADQKIMDRMSRAGK